MHTLRYFFWILCSDVRGPSGHLDYQGRGVFIIKPDKKSEPKTVSSFYLFPPLSLQLFFWFCFLYSFLHAYMNSLLIPLLLFNLWFFLCLSSTYLFEFFFYDDSSVVNSIYGRYPFGIFVFYFHSIWVKLSNLALFHKGTLSPDRNDKKLKNNLSRNFLSRKLLDAKIIQWNDVLLFRYFCAIPVGTH